jgi:hypothetical protein
MRDPTRGPRIVCLPQARADCRAAQFGLRRVLAMALGERPSFGEGKLAKNGLRVVGVEGFPPPSGAAF